MQYVKGPYDELHTINKTATQFDQRLPMEHHAGYIVISFKLLREQTQVINVPILSQHYLCLNVVILRF